MRSPIKRKEIKEALKNKGFLESEGANHTKYIFYHKGKKTGIFTVISRGSKYKEIGIPLLDSMKHQLKLTGSQFEDLIDCPFGKKDYIEHLENMRAL